MGWKLVFLVEQSPVAIDYQNIKVLTEISLKIKQALADQGVCGKDDQEIDHIELFGSHPNANSQSFVLCPGGAYDRSPCGTGTSAKLACLAADKNWQLVKSGIKPVLLVANFASFQQADENGIIPTIRGHAYISGKIPY